MCLMEATKTFRSRLYDLQVPKLLGVKLTIIQAYVNVLLECDNYTLATVVRTKTLLFIYKHLLQLINKYFFLIIKIVK